MAEKKISLGEMLVKGKAITDEQLKKALLTSEKTGAKLGQVLMALGFITEDVLLNCLSKQLNVPFFDLRQKDIDANLVKKLPESYARRLRALVLREQDGGYLVGMVDPLDIHAVDELKNILKRPVHVALVREKNLLHMQDIVYRHTEEITKLAGKLKAELGSGEADLLDVAADQQQLDAPVVKLLQSIFKDAVQVNASDIHIEPAEKALIVRQRVDGVLYEQTVGTRDIAAAITLRLKLIAGLNISEKRLPQDGRFNITIGNRRIDVRLSTLPMQYGESVVMRLLDQSAGLLCLEEIGMRADVLKEVRRLFHMPSGIILVTGPTGSGKTTTLYGILNELNSPEKKIITAEDPIEYRLPRINQVQVNNKLDFTFARILRAMWRQDPDIILVGEMRDQETAEIAMRAALTGHLVLSTLHTNDAAGSALRLLDMGVEGFLVAATLRAILAQRLIRRLCDNCKKPYTLTDHEKEWLQGIAGEKIANSQFYVGVGCNHCGKSGYRGRIGIYEMLELTLPMIKMLKANNPGEFSTIANEHMKGKMLVDRALELAVEGVTSLQEVVKAVGEI